jgi:hypothetical protein
VLAALAAENKQSEENAEFASVKIGLIPLLILRVPNEFVYAPEG